MSEVMKQTEMNVPRYRPATDILEREDGFYIYMDMPGVTKEDMVIDLENDELTITGKTSLAFDGNESFVEKQFGECEYVRSVSISDLVDRETIRANFENGVLELHLPKAKKLQPRHIEITTG